MTKIRLILPLFSIAMLVFIACDKDESSAPTFELNFETVTSEFPVKSGMPNSLAFTTGNIVLESIEFETSSDTDSLEMEFEIESYITIDFATGETNPDLSPIEIKPGNYTEIEIEFELWDQSDIPSIALNGTWTDADMQEHPVQFLFYSGQDFELEIEGNFTITENTSMVAQITFDPGVWFAGVSNEALASATTDEDGVIVISPDQNDDIYQIVEEMIDLVSEVEITMNNI